jgi:hypothetical protein
MVSEAREGRPGPSMIDPPGDAGLSHLTIYSVIPSEAAQGAAWVMREDDPDLSESQVYIEKNLNR